MCNGWPVKETIVKLPTRMKGNLKCTSGNSLSLSGPQNMGIGAVSKTLLTKLKLRLQGRPHIKMPPILFVSVLLVNRLIIFLVVFYLFHRIV